VTVGVEDGLSWLGVRQVLASLLAVSVVLGTTVGGEMGGLVDKRPGLGIGTSGGCVPEGTAEVNRSKLVGD